MSDNEKSMIDKSKKGKKIVVVKKKPKKVIIRKHTVKEKDEQTQNTQKTSQPKRDFSKNRPTSDNKRVFVKKKFNQTGDKDKRVNNRVPNKQDGGNQGNSQVQQSERERSRKKLNQKKSSSTGYQKKNSRQEKIDKIYNARKKERKLINPVPDSIDIIDVVSISDLAKKMNLKASTVISKLMELGTMVTINDKIDADTAEIVAAEFKCKVNIVSLYDETIIEEEKEHNDDLETRPPIVTVMGHVDHGKTKLLDAIRSTDVVAGESGGITQHIGAYSVKLPNNKKITFIDTPGHEAFTMMRARGANVTDIVILIVAADDGVMPQTLEAINHAKQANVPIIVAINKIDKPDINIDKVKQQLSDRDLLPEEWGGSTLFCEISAKQRIGIEKLLEIVLLQAEMLELKASNKVRATGFILESKIEQGRGVVATVLIAKGQLNVGDFFVAGVYPGKVRAMFNDRGEKIKVATSSAPVELIGLEKAPKAGDPFNVTQTEKESKIISNKRRELAKMEEAKSVKKLTIKDLLSQKKIGEVQEIKVIIKADVQGSVEAIKDSLEKLSNDEVRLVTVGAGVGAINERDVILAAASKGIIIGFHVRPNPKAAQVAEKEKVEIKRYNIIYDVIEDIKADMEGLIKPELQEKLIGSIEIKQIFKVSKVGSIAGCIVTSGKVVRNSLIRLIRDDVVVHSGKIKSLKRFKDDASEVHEGTECGIQIENFNDIQVSDTMEAYEIKEIARGLKDVAISSEKRAKEEAAAVAAAAEAEAEVTAEVKESKKR